MAVCRHLDSSVAGNKGRSLSPYVTHSPLQNRAVHRSSCWNDQDYRLTAEFPEIVLSLRQLHCLQICPFPEAAGNLWPINTGWRPGLFAQDICWGLCWDGTTSQPPRPRVASSLPKDCESPPRKPSAFQPPSQSLFLDPAYFLLRSCCQNCAILHWHIHFTRGCLSYFFIVQLKQVRLMIKRFLF